MILNICEWTKDDHVESKYGTYSRIKCYEKKGNIHFYFDFAGNMDL